MGEQLRQPGTESGLFESHQPDAEKGWIERNLKSLSMLVGAAAVSVLAACNTDVKGPRTSTNPDDISAFEADPGYEGCEPFKECGIFRTPEGLVLAYEVPSGFNYNVEASFYDDSDQLVDIKNLELSGRGTEKFNGVSASKVVLKIISPENSTDPVVITSPTVDGEI